MTPRAARPGALMRLSHLRRWRPEARLGRFFTLTMALLLAAGCTAQTSSEPDGDDAVDTSIGDAITTRPTTAPDAPDDEIRTAITAALTAINQTSTESVTAQRAVLEDLVIPAQAQTQRECPPATTTIELEAAWTGLREAGDPDGGYWLPVYIMIYRDARVTGSDVVTVRLWVEDGVAHPQALCVA